MRIRAGFKLTYDCPSPAPMLLMLSIRPERQPDLETPAFLSVSPDIPVHQFIDGFGNVQRTPAWSTFSGGRPVPLADAGRG